jgi:DNA-binding response OmpR family regulator
MSNAVTRKSIIIYSDDSAVRTAMKAALGRRTSDEFATGDALRAYMEENSVDLIILDAEATPEGGMGVSRQLKDEVFECPPVLLITARADDAWLATWSRADAFVMYPIDPFIFAEKAAQLLRQRSLVR